VAQILRSTATAPARDIRKKKFRSNHINNFFVSENKILIQKKAEKGFQEKYIILDN
jgi:hypothetical protein